MDMQKHHGQLIKGISEQFATILNSSKQGIYIYLDDNHKVCNKKFASMLGYASPSQWAAVQESFPQAFVDNKSQQALVAAFGQAVQKFTASALNITWKKKNVGTVNTKVILAPIVFEDHIFALHFIS
jgi:hypothetical protein